MLKLVDFVHMYYINCYFCEFPLFECHSSIGIDDYCSLCSEGMMLSYSLEKTGKSCVNGKTWSKKFIKLKVYRQSSSFILALQSIL